MENEKQLNIMLQSMLSENNAKGSGLNTDFLSSEAPSPPSKGATTPIQYIEHTSQQKIPGHLYVQNGRLYIEEGSFPVKLEFERAY